MTLEEILRLYPDMQRLVIKGIDNRIKLIYNKEEILLKLKSKQAYNPYLRSDGDLDVTMKL